MANHNEYVCNNRNSKCKTSYFYSYYKTKGKKIYYNDSLQKKRLVVSGQTAFDVDYLFELTNLMEQCSANFEALAKVYNRQHNMKLPTDVMGRRDELYRKRMTEAYILYAYLELGSRYCVPNYQVIESDLDSAILNLQESFQKGFNRMWAKHKCDMPGCPDTITFDGGLKPQRNICGAKMSGIRFLKRPVSMGFLAAPASRSQTPSIAGNIRKVSHQRFLLTQ